MRKDLLDAAVRFIDAHGEPSLTLRAVAREAGVAAPSVYRHFANLDALTAAVADSCFAALSTDIAAARDRHADVVDQLLAGCSAYLSYAERFPQRYALLFRPGPSVATPTGTVDSIAAFRLLVDAIKNCVDAGRSEAEDATLAATAIWAGLDGYANLRAHRPRFPWPPSPTFLARLVLDLARIPPHTQTPAAASDDQSSAPDDQLSAPSRSQQ